MIFVITALFFIFVLYTYINIIKPHKPIQTLLLLILLFVFLRLCYLLIPHEGIAIGKYKFSLPTADYPHYTDYQKNNDSTAIIQLAQKQLNDSLQKIHITDSILKEKIASEAKRKYIQDSIIAYEIKENMQSNLFQVLDKSRSKKVRIMHYGDSQIEGDRITSYIRNELQKKYGGYGPGLFPLVPIAKKWSVNCTYSDNWKRFPGFGRKNPNVTHSKYGALMSFSRFAPLTKDSTSHTAWIKIKKPTSSYAKTKRFQQLHIHLSNTANVSYEILIDGNKLIKDSLIKSDYTVLSTDLLKTPEEIIINFSGDGSPNIYGISLEGFKGVVMDNISLRGSSGTIFTKQNRKTLTAMWKTLKPQIFLLEFGGNVVPYIKSEKKCSDYGNWFATQIHFIKKHNPGAKIILIGPSDMAHKEKDEYVTYEYLECVNNTLKQKALSNDCYYWDMFKAMGGKGSMKEWVNSTPKLAAYDYIHFTSKGARKIAEQFYKDIFSPQQKTKK